MTFPLVAALVFTLATLLLAALVSLVMLPFRLPQRRYWRLVCWSHLALFVLHLFVTFPAALGLLASRGLGTRPQEQTYRGPRLDADGKFLLQSWDSLRREAEAGRPEVPSSVAEAAAARRHSIASTDGVTLRAFRLEAKQEPPTATVVLVHGLFRSAMEPEPVAAMLREQGCECWLLELRNHGGSSRAPFTGGLRESDDVKAAADYVRALPGRESVPLVLFGVSFSTIAVSLALPRIEGVAGVVLDAPIEDFQVGAHRMLSFERAGDRRSLFRLDEPWRSATLVALGFWSGFRVENVAASEVLAHLPHDLPMLIIGAGADDRAPPDAVEQLFERLPMPEAQKELWIQPAARHGHVFLEAPDLYRAALHRLLARLRRA